MSAALPRTTSKGGASGSGLARTGSKFGASSGGAPKHQPSARKLKGGATTSSRAVTKAGSAAAAAAGGGDDAPVAGAGGAVDGADAPDRDLLAVAPPREKMRFTLDNLDLSTTLGTGTFGRVRLAGHKVDGGFYALKILKKSEIIRLKQVDHIKSEVRILSMLSHPFIVNLMGHHQDAKRLYMLLEFVPGGELFSHLRREGRFSNDGSKFYTAEIVLAFQHLHSYKVVYRDLKPENLLITRTGHIKITDFGFAKIVKDRTWTLCGTPEYLAPEIIQSKGHGKSVDWWALGILIYEMLAGYPPFYDETPFGIYQKILAGRIDFPRHFDTHAKALIRKLLTADRTQRLGCLRNGAEDVKSHKWFGRLNWEAVYNCLIPAPFIPELRGDNDTRNFDDYDDSVEDTAKTLNATEQGLFSEFDSL